MKTATLNIGKQITMIEQLANFAIIHNEKMGKFTEIIATLDVVVLVGLSKPAKKAKYEKMILENGFVASNIFWCENAGFEGNQSDCISYRIEYKK